MLIENEFEVAAPIDAVWRYFGDVPALAPCLPGATLTETVDADTFKGTVVSKVGPVTLKFGGTATVEERDEAARRIVIQANGSEEKGKGTAQLKVTATLAKAGSGTKVSVVQDLQITGAAAQFGRGMIQDVTTVILRDFAACVQENIGRTARGEDPAAAAAPVGGVGVGFSAMWLALKRFFGRLFGKT